MFLEARHRELGARVRAFGDAFLSELEFQEEDVDALSRRILLKLGESGLLRYAVAGAPGGTAGGSAGDVGTHPGAGPAADPARVGSGPVEPLDVRAICTIRENLAWRMGLADFCFAMQGLGSYPIALAGGQALKNRILPRVAAGEIAAAFALTEAEAGSDAGALSCSARRDGDGWIINGSKLFISNAPIFGVMTLFARTGEGTRGVSAFVVEAGTPGVTVVPQQPMSPHPIGEVTFRDVRLPAEALLGEEGSGFRLALATLDVFRTTVGAAALGMATRAQDEAVAHVKRRHQFGAPLSDLQGVQFLLADSEVELDAARLLVYRAAAVKDGGAARVTREAAVAKLVATENAQRIIDRAVQLHGGVGVMKGIAVERLYREVRALRIYEGATEIQKLVIARERLR